MSQIPEQPPRKPIKRTVVVYFLAGLLIVVILISTVVSYLTSSPPAAQPGETAPSMANNSDGAQFNKSLDETRKILSQNTAEARKVLALAEDLHAKLPPCNAEMRAQLNGQYYLLKSNVADQPDVNLDCQVNNNWAPVPPGVNSIRETPEQRKAEERSGTSGGMSPAEKRRQRMELIYQSSAIPVHFADADQANNTAERPTTQERTDEREWETARTRGERARAGARSSTQPEVLTQAEKPSEDTSENKVAEAIPLGVNLSDSAGPKYPIFEGRILEGLLANRLKGQQGGVVKVQVTTPMYSWDAQHLLIPPGAILLGRATAVKAAGETRLAVLFHRVIMPDGYSFIFASKTTGADQQGATGLTGHVNNRLAAKIVTAVVVGAIEGIGNYSNLGSGSAYVQIQGGATRQGSNEAMSILRDALNMPPEVTVYEGTRVRAFFAEDQAMPEYKNHIVTPTVE
jgi:type IV secretory pathway VirB10-like protein